MCLLRLPGNQEVVAAAVTSVVNEYRRKRQQKTHKSVMSHLLGSGFERSRQARDESKMTTREGMSKIRIQGMNSERTLMVTTF